MTIKDDNFEILLWLFSHQFPLVASLLFEPKLKQFLLCQRFIQEIIFLKVHFSIQMLHHFEDCTYQAMISCLKLLLTLIISHLITYCINFPLWIVQLLFTIFNHWEDCCLKECRYSWWQAKVLKPCCVPCIVVGVYKNQKPMPMLQMVFGLTISALLRFQWGFYSECWERKSLLR